MVLVATSRNIKFPTTSQRYGAHTNLLSEQDSGELTGASYRENQLATSLSKPYARFDQGGVDPVSGSSDFTTLDQSFTSQGNLPISFLSSSMYADDEWRARRNLTLTFAPRAEHYSNPECRSRCFARLAGPFESLSHDPNQAYSQGILINQKKGFAATGQSFVVAANGLCVATIWCSPSERASGRH